MKPFKNQKKPSPTHQHIFSGSARNPEMSKQDDRSHPSIVSCFIEGISLPASFFKKLPAGMTVEASVLLPLLLFFFLNIGCAIEMIRLHGNLQLALWQIGNKLSIYGYALDSGEMPVEGEMEESWWKDIAGIAFASTYVKTQLIDMVGKDYLNQSPLKKGTDSFWLWESDLFGSEDEIDIIVTYSVSPWSSLAGFLSFRMANRYYAHIWNGYQLPGEDTGGGTQMVFVTENASVYHLDENCTHLWLSVQQISVKELGEVRNQYGGRYRACEKCARGEQGAFFYISEKGDCYHYIRGCPGLKRTVYSIPLEEADYQPCSRCGQKVQ